MKFKKLLAEVSGEVAEYRRDIFNTIIIWLIIGTRRKCVYNILVITDSWFDINCDSRQCNDYWRLEIGFIRGAEERFIRY